MNRPAAQLGAAGGLLAVYIGSIVAANYLTGRYGLITVWPRPGLQATAGTPLIGGVIMTRDLLQDAIGRRGVLAAIATGAAVSFAVAPHRIAIASGITFAIAETLQWALYRWRAAYPWGTRRWARVITVANGAGDVADTFLFLWIAGFPVVFSTVAGQLVGKAYVTAAILAAGMLARRAARPAGAAA